MGGIRARMVAASCLLSTVVACRTNVQPSPGEPASDANGPTTATENRSGTRLVWQARQTSYGVSLGGLQPTYFAESFWGEWYDSQRGHACEFVVTSNGETHCVPPGQVFYGPYFLDPECR